MKRLLVAALMLLSSVCYAQQGGFLGGGGGSTALIQSQTLGTSSATIVFSAIPQTYSSLQLFCSTQGSAAGAQTFQIQFNGDTGSNYNYNITANSGTVSSATAVGTSAGIGATGPSGSTSSLVAFMPQYSKTVFLKTVQALSIEGTSSGTPLQESAGAVWNNTAAITSLTLSLLNGSFVTGSSCSLYGIS